MHQDHQGCLSQHFYLNLRCKVHFNHFEVYSSRCHFVEQIFRSFAFCKCRTLCPLNIVPFRLSSTKYGSHHSTSLQELHDFVLHKDIHSVCPFVMGLVQCPQGSFMLEHLTGYCSHC